MIRRLPLIVPSTNNHFECKGGSGIGQQSAYSLAEAGARAIVFADKNGETAASSAEESKKYATNPDYQSAHFVVDVCDKDGVDAMVDFVVNTFGQLDYAVNSAGVSRASRISKLSSRSLLLFRLATVL